MPFRRSMRLVKSRWSPNHVPDEAAISNDHEIEQSVFQIGAWSNVCANPHCVEFANARTIADVCVVRPSISIVYAAGL